MNKAVNATAYTLKWCFETSITTWKSNEARGMRDRKPKYESTERIAMTVKMMAPAVGWC